METRTLTNEEQKVRIYSTNNSPTDSASVTNDTGLKELNLNLTEKELPERIRTKHVNRLHPYLGKYIPQLVEIFLRKYFHAGDIVLDPFCGSGTTLVQANELNINSVVFDISAFNILLCKVKTNDYDIRKLEIEVKDILRRVQETADSVDLFTNQEINKNDFDTDNEYLNAWFAKNALKEILAFKSFIKDYQYQDVLKIILSRSARFSRLTTHFDLDFPKTPQTTPYYCYKHRRMCQPTGDAMKFLLRYGLDTVKRIGEYSKLKTNAFVDIRNVDSRKEKLDYLVDGVVTSPPYVGLIDYHDQHKYAFNLLGLTDQSDIEIGAAKQGSSKKAKDKYIEDMASVFSNVSTYVKPKGKIIVVAGDKNNLYPIIAETANLNLEDVVVRHVNRRTRRRSTEFFESCFIYTKK